MSRVYDSLPPAYRAEDAQQDPPYPLRRYVSLVGDQLDEIYDLAGRLSPVVGRSELADPDLADAAWLPWIAQMLGVSLAGLTSTAQRREAIRNPGTGWRVGTLAGIEAAIRATLTDPVGALVTVTRDASDPWLLHVTTKTSETPDPLATLAAITAAGARPAGVIIDWTAYSITWGILETEAPTWTDIEILGSWAALEMLA